MTTAEYLKLPYHIVITYEAGDNRYYSEVKELKGCISNCQDEMLIIAMTHGAMRLWIETALERGLEIPVPKEE